LFGLPEFESRATGSDACATESRDVVLSVSRGLWVEGSKASDFDPVALSILGSYLFEDCIEDGSCDREAHPSPFGCCLDDVFTDDRVHGSPGFEGLEGFGCSRRFLGL
jgi:hypothetical protein